jgi:hypothetical protein
MILAYLSKQVGFWHKDLFLRNVMVADARPGEFMKCEVAPGNYMWANIGVVRLVLIDFGKAKIDFLAKSGFRVQVDTRSKNDPTEPNELGTLIINLKNTITHKNVWEKDFVANILSVYNSHIDNDGHEMCAILLRSLKRIVNPTLLPTGAIVHDLGSIY